MVRLAARVVLLCGVFMTTVVPLPGAQSPRRAWGIEVPRVGNVELGGRFQYRVRLDRDAVPFPWNSSTRSTQDRTRLMIDLKALATPYGSLYLKGVALWDDTDQSAGQKRFRFDQGDYLWEQELTRVRYGLRLFANERRFFVNDRLLPLIKDDRTGATGANRGLRGDVTIGGGVDVNALLAVLGDDFDRSRRIGYLRALWSTRFVNVTGSYLLNDGRALADGNQATVKAEVSSHYRRFFGAVSYLQTGFQDDGAFFPSGRFDWGRIGDGVTAVLPTGGSLMAELRASRIRTGDAGLLNLIYRYQTMGNEYLNTLAQTGTARVRHNGMLLFNATEVSIHGRLRYRRQERFTFENVTQDAVDVAGWATLRNGVELMARGGVGNVEDNFVLDTKRNFIHLAIGQRKSRFRSSAHVLWKDLETVFSERRFAWDTRLALSPNWGMYWRFMIGRNYTLSDATFIRLEYRPNQRIFITAGYGRQVLGDGPFTITDIDLGLVDPNTALYILSVRGDF